MKTLVVAIAILSSSLINSSYGSGILNMDEKLREVVTFKKGSLQMKEDKTEFVKISFTINKNGKIEILGMNYSDELVKNQLIEKLSKMRIDEKHDSQEVYNYNFTFKKL